MLYRYTTRRRLFAFGLIGLVAVIAFIVMDGCAATHPRRNPLGEPFPSVVGKDLHEQRTRLPEDFAGQPVLLLVGYEQNSQFDLDRWLLGLTQSGALSGIAVREVPTIPGLMPGLFSGFIDSGMRSGIPDEDWGSVITVYGDGDAIAKFTGNETPLPGRILLLDANGTVIFFHDEGYSVGALMRLIETIEPVGG